MDRSELLAIEMELQKLKMNLKRLLKHVKKYRKLKTEDKIILDILKGKK